MSILNISSAAVLLLACAPLARAGEDALAKKEARLKHAAEVLQQLSDDEYLKLSSAPVRASRAEAISAVYGTLAALQYQQALKNGPKTEERPQVEAALQTRLKDAQALVVNPDTLEETGFWGDVVDYINRDDYRPSFRGAAVAAVRGGRSLDAEADKKAAGLKKSLKTVEWRLQEPELEASRQAALRYEAGKIYEGLAGLDAQPETAPAPAKIAAPAATPAPEKAAEAPQAKPDEDISAESARMNEMGKKMQEELGQRRALLQETSR